MHPRFLFKKLKSNTKGSTLTVFAIAMPVLAGALAISIEAGYWMKTKSGLQMVADMAAYAGLQELSYNGKSAAINAARLDAMQNGFTNNARGSMVVNIPPTTGTYTTGDAVEVLIKQKGLQFFSKIIPGAQEVTYSVRSVALTTKGGSACLLALNPTLPGSLDVTGSSIVNMKNCYVAVNSDDIESTTIGGSGSLTAACLTTAGDVSGSANLTCGNPKTNANPIKDPYSSVLAPRLLNYPTCQIPQPKPGIKFAYTLTPGRYCGNYSFKSLVELIPTTGPNGSNLFILDGARFNFKSNFSRLVGSGVTIILMNGAELTGINGGLTLQLTAPSSGDYAGIAIYSDPRSQPIGANVKLNGSSSSYIEGLIYYPTQNLEYKGNMSHSAKCTLLVANTFTMSGNSTIETTGCEENLGIIPPSVPGGSFIVE